MDLATFVAVKDRMEELGAVTDKGLQLPGFSSVMQSTLRRGQVLGCMRCGSGNKLRPCLTPSSHSETLDTNHVYTQLFILCRGGRIGEYNV